MARRIRRFAEPEIEEAVGIAAMAFIVFAAPLSTIFPPLAGPLAPFAAIAWPWYVLIGTTITITAGVVSSLTHAEPALGTAT